MSKGRIVPFPEWEQLSTPDVYFSPEYHATSGLALPDFAGSVLLEWSDHDGTVYLPLLLRKIEGTEYFDATSAYGYGGPWKHGSPDLSSFKKFHNQWASENNVVTSFIRFHPLINNSSAFMNLWPLRFVGHTAIWALDGSDNLVEGMAKNHRKNWRRAVRAGVQARVTETPNEYTTFRRLYEQSMVRLGARSSYWLRDSYWVSLRDRLRESSLLVEAVYEDRVVAAAWCLFSDNYLHFHLSGTSDEGRQLGGAYICRVAAAEWAQNAGLSMAHHGGGVGGQRSSLLDWKSKFDPSTSLGTFNVAEVIHNEKQYSVMANGSKEREYFPPWRNPSGRQALVR